MEILMYTSQSLLEIAADAEAVFKSLPKEAPSRDFYELHRRMEDALVCASWMEKAGIAELANAGPFMSKTYSRGRTVLIRKGSRIFGTGSKIPRDGLVSKRGQIVTLHDFNKGYIDRRDATPRVKNGEVQWAGSGGYWRWTDMNNVIAVEA